MSVNQKIKIAVVGPESTGKSTISKQLAKHYNTAWVPEYSREYCEKLTSPCTLQDEINIFYGQIAHENIMLPEADKILICDTTILTVKIWCDYLFKQTPQIVLNELHRTYDFYLLMNIDLPWEDDPLRDFPDMREYFMEVWKKELDVLKADYVIISGNETQRLTNAINVIEHWFNIKNT